MTLALCALRTLGGHTIPVSHPVTFTSLFPTSGSFRVTPCNLAPKLKVTKNDTELHISGSIVKGGVIMDRRGGCERSGVALQNWTTRRLL